MGRIVEDPLLKNRRHGFRDRTEALAVLRKVL